MVINVIAFHHTFFHRIAFRLFFFPPLSSFRATPLPGFLCPAGQVPSDPLPPGPMLKRIVLTIN